ncbi:MAG TPA: hypothetical protein DCM38_10230 [Gammaproteobacteria bacterium]|nr:hypothetical protein [Gammaproteobacteria bacterium]
MNKGLRLALIGMGLFFLLLGIFLNFQLYTSLAGDSPLYKYSYGLIGIGLDVSKVICLVLGAFLLTQRATALIVAGFFSIGFYLVLSLISWAASWGFTLVVTQHYENKAFQKNAQVQSAQATVDDAVAKVEGLSQYANSASVTEAQSTLSELQTQLDALWHSPARNSRGHRTGKTVQSQLGGSCPGSSWYHRQYCPQIQALESDISEEKKSVDNHAAYLAALEYKNTMMKDFANLDLAVIRPNSYMHPLFIGMSAIFGTTPQLVKYRLLLLTSAMIELLGSLFFVIGLLIKEKAKYSIEDMLEAEKQKYQMLADLSQIERLRHEQETRLEIKVTDRGEADADYLKLKAETQ